ncbi:hypothetical protein OAS84_01900 [Candidatus Pelagibacter sp.]|jgi:hypothetical protein|nr:hypothetical protein [Candidatus Pelagibacter sp.]
MGLRSMLPEIFQVTDQVGKIKFCPAKDFAVKNRFEFFSYKKIKNIFIGDSVIDGAWSEGLFNLNYTLIAKSGMTIDCTIIIVDYIKKIEPKNVIIYLGGNDADGASNYGVDDAINKYQIFLSELNKIISIEKIYLLGINYSTEKKGRSSEYVKNLNDFFESVGENEKKIIYIESFEKLDFRKKLNLELTYDGEHLKYHGYKEWFTYLSKKIDNFILE